MTAATAFRPDADTAVLLIDVQESFRHRPYWDPAGFEAYMARTNALLTGALVGGLAWLEARELGLLHVLALPAWAALVAAVVALDFATWVGHVSMHAFPLFWRFHRVHHSDRSFTVTTGVRFHPGELLLSLPIRLAAVVLLGAPVYGVLAFELTFTVANLIEHGDIDYPRRLDAALGRLLSRGHLQEAVWGRSGDLVTRTVDTHVSQVRKKLDLRVETGYRVVPIYNYGYRLEKISPAP